MPRRAVVATISVALLLGGAVAPAAAATAATHEPGQVCVLTDYDPQTGERTGFCVWVPIGPPFSAAAS